MRRWFVAVPVSMAILFVGTFALDEILQFTMPSVEEMRWWSFPLYVALFSPILLGGVCAIVGLGIWAADGQRPKGLKQW